MYRGDNFVGFWFRRWDSFFSQPVISGPLLGVSALHCQLVTLWFHPKGKETFRAGATWFDMMQDFTRFLTVADFHILESWIALGRIWMQEENIGLPLASRNLCLLRCRVRWLLTSNLELGKCCDCQDLSPKWFDLCCLAVDHSMTWRLQNASWYEDILRLFPNCKVGLQIGQELGEQEICSFSLHFHQSLCCYHVLFLSENSKIAQDTLQFGPSEFSAADHSV